jgi:glycosyltransferase involved in cell wall biosynthesis
MKPLVTALIDTYNHERYIEQAIVSVLEQELSAEELEIVVVDDGSTDGTASIVERFAPRVKHVRKKNGGQASAFNAGYGESHGEIVALLDGDDWWAKGKLKAVLEALEAKPELGAASHGYFEYHEETGEKRARGLAGKRFVNVATLEAVEEARTAWPYLLMGALTVRRKVLEWIMPIPEELVFMADSAIQVAAIVMGAVVLEEPLFYYRHHGTNLWAIDAGNREKLRRRCEMTDLVYERLYEMLLKRGVEREKVARLIDPNWVEIRRLMLRTFGGSPLRTFATEMKAFESEAKGAGWGYRVFKYGVTGAPMLLLPPRVFYRMRDWYARENLGKLRSRVVRKTRAKDADAVHDA